MKKLKLFLVLSILSHSLLGFAYNCPPVNQFSCHKSQIYDTDICEASGGWFIWTKPGVKVVAFDYAEIFGTQVGGLMCYYRMSDSSTGVAPFDPMSYVKPTTNNWSICFVSALCCSDKNPQNCQFARTFS
jgi:hypothetical protein